MKHKPANKKQITPIQAREKAIKACQVEIGNVMDTIERYSSDGKCSVEFKRLDDGTVAFLTDKDFEVIFKEECHLHLVKW